jgi:hypothetical protein
LWFDLVGPMKAYSLRANTAADKQKFFTEIRSAVSKLGITVEEMERSGAYSISYGQMAGGKYDGTWLFGKVSQPVSSS